MVEPSSDLPANPSSEQVLERGLQALRDLLPRGWTVQERVPRAEALAPGDEPGETLVDISGQNSAGMLLVAARPSLTPAAAMRILGPKMSLLQRIYAGSEAIVIAPWISRKAREVLQERHVGFLDLTGNATVTLQQPALHIRTDGAQRDPRGRGAVTQRGISGPKAARLVRIMTDAAPPYIGSELAEHAGLSQPYASRTLEVMEELALITRSGRMIVDVDWEGLLRARGASYSLLKANPSVTMLAPSGVSRVLDRLRQFSGDVLEEIAITGAAAANAIDPLVAGEQLMLYTPTDVHSSDELGARLGLLRAPQGDVVLMRPSDKVVFAGKRNVNALWHVAFSQLVLDCLAGPGRLPAAGEAVLRYMRGTESQWRAPSLSALAEYRK
jgi:hypothetical protein